MENPTIGLAFIAGILSFISPCVLPLVPAYIGYMGGRLSRNVALETSSGQAKNDANALARFEMLAHGAAFVLGFTLVFILIGLMTTAFVSAVGSSVTVLTEIIARVGGVLIIFFGLHFMGILPNLFKRLRKTKGVLNTPLTSLAVAAALSALILWGFVETVIGLPVLVAVLLAMALGGAFHQPGPFWNRVLNTLEIALYSDTRRDIEGGSGASGLPGSFGMGVVFSAGWTPCIGPLLGTILTIAANTGDVGMAVPLLGAYSLGLGIPFMLTALMMDGAQGILRRLQKHMRTIELASGALLVAIGVLVASGQLTTLSQNLGNQFADFSFAVEECGVGAASGHVAWGDLGACLNGTVIPVALNQSAGGDFNDATRQLNYVFTLDEAQDVDVEFTRLPEDTASFQPNVALLDQNGDLIAESDTLRTSVPEAPDEAGEVFALTGVTLPEAGRYTLRVRATSSADADFRLRVREAEAVTFDDAPEAADSDAAPLDSEQVGSISDFAETTGPAEGLAIGNRAPDFTFTTLDGQTMQLSDWRGQPLLLNFWGTWCGPCRREMPEFQNIYDEKSDEFEILALAVRDNETDVRAFIEEFGLTFTIAVDEGDAISRDYGIVTQPSTLMLDANGVIIARHQGMLIESQIQELVNDALTS